MAFWSIEEARAFRDATEADRLGPLWQLALGTGMRRGELMGLRWIDVDLDAGTLHVRHTRVAVGYQVTTGTPKPRRVCAPCPFEAKRSRR